MLIDLLKGISMISSRDGQLRVKLLEHSFAGFCVICVFNSFEFLTVKYDVSHSGSVDRCSLSS